MIVERRGNEHVVKITEVTQAFLFAMKCTRKLVKFLPFSARGCKDLYMMSGINILAPDALLKEET